MRTLLLPAMACTLLLTSAYSFAATSANHPPHVTRYIENYNEIAIREMHRSGIPASIILAQGIHESSWGLGKLSANSNNHFGIKCKTSWRGPTFYIEDDDFENGILVKSCFRVYNSVDDSYIDHTNFLVEGTRYETLFNFDRTDYINWSKGLKSCGYATDPSYDTKLIRTIEKYNLTKYDEVTPPVISAPVFHLPAPEPMPLTVIPQETTTDLVVSTTVSQLMNSTSETNETIVIAEEMLPAAVSIENYNRNDNRITTVEKIETEEVVVANNESTAFVEEEEEQEEGPIVREEVVREQVVTTNATTILPPSNYQFGSLPRTEYLKPVLPKTEQELTVIKVDDNHLQVMRGKMRVARKPRR
ncbi:MAG: hypothetical protein ACI9CQ_000236 [Saprospiraceae bacterium]|jgi:hypothetical protein